VVVVLEIVRGGSCAIAPTVASVVARQKARRRLGRAGSDGQREEESILVKFKLSDIREGGSGTDGYNGEAWSRDA